MRLIVSSGVAILLLLVLIIYISFIREEETCNNYVNEEYYPVLSIIDGDTIEIEIEGKKELVRLIGIDTPEVASPYTEEQCHGEEASDYTKTLLSNKFVRLVSDQKSDDRDKYNRLLRYIYLGDGTMVNAEILKEGHARLYPYFPFDEMAEFIALENSAKENSLGLWGECE